MNIYKILLVLLPTCFSVFGARGRSVSSILRSSNDDDTSSPTTLKLSKLQPDEGFFIYGEAGSFTGSSVSSGGDINGDGVDDIIIGAFHANFLSGTTYVLYGGNTTTLPMYNISLANLTSTQGFTVIGGPSEYSGVSVSNAGDVNGDGFADIFIASGNSKTVCYVIYGNTTMPRTIYLSNFSEVVGGFTIMHGEYSSSFSVSGAGDLNNDTYADIIIGAPYAATGGLLTNGIAYIVYGGNAIPSIIDLASPNTPISTIVTLQSNIHLGESVSGAGDFNGDNITDVIIGAPLVQDSKGAAFIIFGNNSMPTIINVDELDTHGVTLIGGLNTYSGTRVSGGGNVYGSPVNDVVVLGTANAYVVYGSESLPIGNIDLDSIKNNGYGFVITSEYHFSSVSSAGNINGNNFADILLGTQYANYYDGATYVVYGGSDLLPNIELELGNIPSFYGFTIDGNHGISSGISVCSSGDINGDGYYDIIIGAPSILEQSQIQQFPGVYVVYGAISGFETSSPSSSPTPHTDSHIESEHGESLIPGLSPLWADVIYAIVGAVGFGILYEIIKHTKFGINLYKSAKFFVLDNLGFKYTLICRNNNQKIKENEIRIELNDTHNGWICKTYTGKSSVKIVGIPSDLNNIIFNALENPALARSFRFTQDDKNNLHEFLVYHDVIAPKKILCGLDCYTELGYINGIIYAKFSSSLKEVRQKYKDEGVTSIDKGTSINNTCNPTEAFVEVDHTDQTQIEIPRAGNDDDFVSTAIVNPIHV